MLGQGLITPGDLTRASLAPLPAADDIRLPGTRGPAQHFVEYVKQQLIPYYGSGKVFGGGLRVYTTIDLKLQSLARSAISKWLTSKDGPAAALVAIDPRDGRILAMVGGSNFSKSQFNLAVQGERQPGSAFKPFVLATALAQGISPRTVFESKPQLINLGDRLWSVRNYEGAYLGPISLETAAIHSDNAVFAQLTKQVGPKNVVRMAHALGVTSPLDNYLGIGLGVEAVNPLEMARAFATLANGGVRVDTSLFGNAPRAVLRVEADRTVDLNEPVGKQILNGNTNALVTSILQRVVAEGTGRRAALTDRPVAGKTGTTENYGDAWFVGYTPQLAVAVWVGYPTGLKPMLREFNGEAVAGGTYPAMIWKTFVQSAFRALGAPPAFFPTPAIPYSYSRSVVFRDGAWRLDNGLCRDAHVVVFFAGFEPRREARCALNEVDVPRVVGAALEDAETRLADQPLTAEVITRPAKAGEKLGVVVAQFPARGVLPSWDTVRLVVPKATNGTVPNVVGLRLRAARTRLDSRELAGRIAAFVEGDTGIVLSQRPRPGLAAVPNMTISLVVGRG
jgi:membrane peptidoglycan carboxypeptidase